VNHAHEIAALSERIELLNACRHVALVERNDGRCWVPRVGTLSRQLTQDADIFQVARQLDRAPVVGDQLMTAADLDREIGALTARLRQLRDG
jgi:hypothetical protein